MDVAGARALRDRIDLRQQEQWREAAAVRSGYQDPADPDAEHLVRSRSRVRIYVRPAERPFAKALVSGRWQTVRL
jgi:hypothetical protein